MSIVTGVLVASVVSFDGTDALDKLTGLIAVAAAAPATTPAAAAVLVLVLVSDPYRLAAATPV
jgi:hypothetical protein